jgi:membrane protein DedA with SNARE-associated domain
LRRKGETSMLKTGVVTGFLLILMGSIDCLTTIIGVLYSGAKELNPFIAGIVSTNIGAFLVLKIASTILIAATYLAANRILMQMSNKDDKSFKISFKMLRYAYAGLVVFLAITVVNNLLILMR